MTKERLVKVTDWDIYRKYRDAGRKVHIIQMKAPDYRVPEAWWFEPAARHRQRQAEQNRHLAAIQRDLAKVQRKATRASTPKYQGCDKCRLGHPHTHQPQPKTTNRRRAN